MILLSFKEYNFHLFYLKRALGKGITLPNFSTSKKSKLPLIWYYQSLNKIIDLWKEKVGDMVVSQKIAYFSLFN